MSLSEDIQAWRESARVDIIKEYQNQGRKASGTFEKELRVDYINESNAHTFSFMAPAYAVQMEVGRRPNKNQDKKALRRWVGGMGTHVFKPWCISKGIPEGLAYAIAYKVAREGYKGKPLFEKVINEKRIAELTKIFGTNYKNEIKKIWLGQFRQK